MEAVVDLVYEYNAGDIPVLCSMDIEHNLSDKAHYIGLAGRQLLCNIHKPAIFQNTQGIALLFPVDGDILKAIKNWGKGLANFFKDRIPVVCIAYPFLIFPVFLPLKTLLESEVTCAPVEGKRRPFLYTQFQGRRSW